MEIAGIPSPSRKTVCRLKTPANQPESPATVRMPPDSASRPSTCTMPRSARTVSSARAAPAASTRKHLGRHGVRHHILDYGADRNQKCAEDIKTIRPQQRQPAAGGAREREHSTGGEGCTDEDVGLALRAEDRDAVHQLAEHHFHGPGQVQPHRNAGELCGRERQALLHPHVAIDVDQAERPVGEIHHQERQIGEPECPDRLREACGQLHELLREAVEPRRIVTKRRRPVAWSDVHRWNRSGRSA